ncbi:MAG: response regulator transcription factor [Candidatus Dormibacteria bacterium]
MKDAGRPRRILVAEDDRALRRLIEMLLRNDDVDVLTVGDGAGALAVFDDFAPDALVCDVMMPKLSGFTVCRDLRIAWGARLPIILLTARCFDEDIQTLLELGGITFIINKPFHARQLMSAIGSVIRTAHGDLHDLAPAALPEPFGWLTPAQVRPTLVSPE